MNAWEHHRVIIAFDEKL